MLLRRQLGLVMNPASVGVAARSAGQFSPQRTQRELTPATEPATFVLVLVIVLLIVIELTGVRFDYDYDYDYEHEHEHEYEHEHEHEKGSTAGRILAPREDSADLTVQRTQRGTEEAPRRPCRRP